MTVRDPNEPSLALFCDYENVALGARDANHESFDIGAVLERLLDKGKIVVKKAYCDWERYKSARRGLHEAAFELIEIPHVSYSGKNSADIRLVVDALDLCHTKSHVDTFVLITGDSDFSPLVSKLRENDKRVIGLGVKNSTSDLLVDNCDEFIYYDDLVDQKKSQRESAARGKKKATANKTSKNKSTKVSAEVEPGDQAASAKDKDNEALDLVVGTVEALFHDRSDTVWGSMVKQTLKRKRPNFAENRFGYRSFNQLLEAAAARGLLELQKDERSGGYVITKLGPKA